MIEGKDNWYHDNFGCESAKFFYEKFWSPDNGKSLLMKCDNLAIQQE